MTFLPGTEGNDRITGTPDADSVDAKGGNDTVASGDGSDVVFAGSGNDVVLAGNGNDFVAGEAGNDHLFGSAGDDALVGGAGVDTLSGGGGRDTFVYNSTTESGVGTGNRDIITDFEVGFDRIDLSFIDANVNAPGNQAFTFIGGAAFHGVAGEMRAAVVDSGNMVLRMDVNGDGFSDMNIEISGTPILSGGDFVL